MKLNFERVPGEESGRIDFTGYAIAILAIVVAALLCWSVRLVVAPDVLGVTTLAVFSAAALLTAWIAGTGPGFVATALGAIVLWLLLSGPQHALALLAPRDIAVVVATAALSALVTAVVGRLRARHAALLQGLPDIERRARDRANDAAGRLVEEERRKAAAAKEDLAAMQQKLQQWRSAESRDRTARGQYLAAAKLAFTLPLRAIQQYAARLQRRDGSGLEMCEEHIATLLDAVLVPARVESGLLVPTNTDVSLAAVVERAVALVEPLAAARSTTVECGNLDVPHVRADAPILTHVLARLLLEEAMAGQQRVLRLEAKEGDDGRVTLECRSSTDDRLTTESAPAERPLDGVVWSSMAAEEQLGRMGGAVTRTRVPGAETSFTVTLSSRAPSAVEEPAGPVVLWPPIAFRFPRA